MCRPEKGGLSSRHTCTHVRNKLTLMWRYEHKTLSAKNVLRHRIWLWRISAIICTADLRSQLLNGLIIRCAKTRHFRYAVTMMERRPESRHSDTPPLPPPTPPPPPLSAVVPCAAVTQMSNRAARWNCETACELLLVVSGSFDCDLFCPSGKISREQDFLMKARAYHFYSLTNNVSAPTASQLTWFILWTAC